MEKEEKFPAIIREFLSAETAAPPPLASSERPSCKAASPAIDRMSPKAARSERNATTFGVQCEGQVNHSITTSFSR